MNIPSDIRDVLETEHSESIKSRFTRVQNNILDNMPAKLSASQRAVIDAVIRKTNGYNYATRKLSFEELEKLTGYKQRTIKNSVKKLCTIGILCILQKNKKTEINDYYIDPYWNTDKSIRKQLENLLEKKSLAGPCPVQEFNFIENESLENDQDNIGDIDIETTIENQIENMDSGVSDNTTKQLCSDQKITSDPTDIDRTKELIKGLVSSIPDDTTTHIYSEFLITSALNVQDPDPGTGLKKQTEKTDEEKANVCFLASAETGIKRSLIDSHMEKYGFEYFLDKLEILEDFKIDHVLSNPAGYFTDALEKDYQPSKRLRDKREAKKWLEEEELKYRQKCLQEEQEKLQAERNAQILTAKKSKLSDCEYSELREKAKQMLIDRGAIPYFIMPNAIESEVNLMLLSN